MTEKNCVPSKFTKNLCFNELDFIQKMFDADKFLQELRKNVNLEKMRDDLGVYLKILRSAMIELINKDYGDYVTLSSNLIGLDEAIITLETPVGQLKEEILQIKQCIDDTMTEIANNLNQHKKIRGKKQNICSLIKYHNSKKKLDNIFHFCDIFEATLKLDVIERAATEFNHLKFYMYCFKHDISTKKINEMIKLDKCLRFHLKILLVTYIIEKDTTSLIQCLKIYIRIDKVTNAEDVVRKKIVVPAVEDIISEYKFQNDPLGLKGTYKKLETILDTTLKEILELTLSSNRMSVKGFNFLVNSYWSEVEQRIEDYLPIIFAAGNPKLFHKQYMETLDFLLTIQKKCCTKESINELRNHPQYERFIKKWNLPIYFQIRFQEIAVSAESILSGNISLISIKINKNSVCSNNFTLYATCITWNCLVKVWENDVYLPQILNRFLKLYLHICSRYLKWCQSSLKQECCDIKINDISNILPLAISQKIEFLIALYTDIEKLSIKISTFTKVIKDKIYKLNSKIINILNDCAKEAANYFKNCLPLITEEIVKEILRYSVIHLKQINDIPRLFRRTNREIPTKPCVYVKRALNYLILFHTDYKNIIPQTCHQWLVLALTDLTQQYTLSVINVLTSVQKTEESLKRLKKIRDKSTGISTSENQGISDDEKIRLQLRIDISTYIQMIKELDVQVGDIDALKKLLEVIEIATKNKIDIK